MEGLERIRYQVARNGPKLAAVLVAAGLVALTGVGWAYAHPPTTEVTERTAVRTVGAELHTSALVTGDSVLYRNGFRLHDEPVYLLSATPRPTVNVSTTTPANASVRVEQHLELLYTVTRGDEEFWRRSRTILEEETTRAGTVTTGERVDVREIRERLGRIRAEVGAAGDARVELRLTVTYEVDGYSDRLTVTAPVRLEDGWYEIGTDSTERTHATPIARTVSVPRRNGRLFLGGGFAGALSVLLGATVLYRWRGSREPESELAHRVHRSRYSDWISTGEVPDELGDRVVRTESLEDLVDVAIDTGNRVVHDPDRGVYVVFAGTATYLYGYFRFVERSEAADGSAEPDRPS